MQYYFLTHRYKRDYILIINVENDANHASFDVVHANPIYKLEWTAPPITLKRSTFP